MRSFRLKWPRQGNSAFAIRHCRITPLIADELSAGGSDTADDGHTDADIPVAQFYRPSSFGMSFCVDGEAKTIKASATWGQYKREKRDEQQDYKGNPLKVWKRYTRGGRLLQTPDYRQQR